MGLGSKIARDAGAQRPLLPLHDRVLGEYPVPAWLISGSLLDNRWVVRLEDSTKFRAADVPISLDVPIAPGRLLSALEFESDLLTTKLLLIHSIRAGLIKSGKVAAIFVRNYLQFVRWRIGIGIYRNADVNDEILEFLKKAIQARGISGLPPVYDAFRAAKLEIEAGRRALPTYLKGKQVRFASNEFLMELGVPNMTSLPPSLRNQIRELASAQGLQDVGKELSTKCENVPTENRVANFVSPIFALHTFASKLRHDPIGCHPFAGESRQSVARSITTREADRTFTVPALQACHLIDKALTWVLNYFPDIQRLVNDVEHRATELTGPDGHWRPHERAIREILADFEPTANSDRPGSPWPIHPSYFEASRGERTRPSLRTVLYEYLLIASVIVIAAFAARRHDEIDSLRHDCIIEAEVGILLRSYIEKTTRDMEEIPVPYSVKAAVDVLLWLSEERRNRTQEPWIVAFDEVLAVRTGKFEVQPDEVKRSGKVQIYRALERFSVFVETPALEDGSHWVPRPHQFRRWFGVTYYNRYRFPQLLALTHFFRHFDPNQTRRYITERNYSGFIKEKDEARAHDRMRDFDKAGEEFRQERFLAVIEGKETMRGFGGEFLKRELDKRVRDCADRLEISDDRTKRMTLIEAISPVVKSTKLEPNELGHSYCKCGPSPLDLAQAECVKLAKQFESDLQEGPNPTYASDQTCGACANGVSFEENERFLDEIMAQLNRAADTPRPPAVQRIEAERLAVLTEQRERRSRGDARS